jgi:hypothetical protein
MKPLQYYGTIVPKPTVPLKYNLQAVETKIAAIKALREFGDKFSYGISLLDAENLVDLLAEKERKDILRHRIESILQ